MKKRCEYLAGAPEESDPRCPYEAVVRTKFVQTTGVGAVAYGDRCKGHARSTGEGWEVEAVKVLGDVPPSWYI